MPALMSALPAQATGLFRHVTAENAPLYRAIMDVFAAAKRQFRLHLRPDEVLAEAQWSAEHPTLEALQLALSQLVDWGNLQAQPDTARVATIEDFYRKRLLYRMTAGGEAAEAGLTAFIETLTRKGEFDLAERVRFELTSPVRDRRFSRPVHSTALPPLQRPAILLFAPAPVQHPHLP